MLLEFTNTGEAPDFESGESEGLHQYCLGLVLGCPKYQNSVFKVQAHNDEVSYVNHCMQLLQAFFFLTRTSSGV